MRPLGPAHRRPSQSPSLAVVFASFRLRLGSGTTPRLPEEKGRVLQGNRPAVTLAAGSGPRARVPGAAIPGCLGAGPREGRALREPKVFRKRRVRTTDGSCGLGPAARLTQPLRGALSRGALPGVSIVMVNNPQLPQLQLPSPPRSILL